MMRKIIFVLFIAASLTSKAADNFYHYTVNIEKIDSDRVKVNLVVPKINSDTINFYFPKIVPGTYAVYDFGKYIVNFKAYDNAGNILHFTHPNLDTWHFDNAKKLSKITYEVNDTWDSVNVKNFVFEPAGTNIEAGKNYVLNTHGFFGFFQGLKRDTFKIKVEHPEGFYGSTGLSNIESTTDADFYTVKDYMRLVDSPIMYCKPDTAIIKVGNANVLVSVYDADGEIHAKGVAKSIKTILNAQKKYMGGHLPIKKYAFIIYLFRGMSGSGAAGALEHSNSSFYFLPETNAKSLGKTMKEVAAHEFFHIITPLTFHSKEIGDFNYEHPDMSEHLWMYEGCTEYFAGHVQVYEGLITPAAYLQIVHKKMMGAGAFNDTLPFTVMSKYCLHKYKSQYNNVYQKGALIGMCLDIKLRSLSHGKYGLRNMMLDLSHKYGRNKPFNDSDLFNIIAKQTYPQVKTFLETYVSGDKPLPFKKILAKVGITYKKTDTIQVATLGGALFGYDSQTGNLKIMGVADMNKTGKDLGYKNGDELVKLDGDSITVSNFNEVKRNFGKKVKPGEKFTVTVLRKGKPKDLKAKAVFEKKPIENHVFLNSKATPQEIALRKAWLGRN